MHNGDLVTIADFDRHRDLLRIQSVCSGLEELLQKRICVVEPRISLRFGRIVVIPQVEHVCTRIYRIIILSLADIIPCLVAIRVIEWCRPM